MSEEQPEGTLPPARQEEKTGTPEASTSGQAGSKPAPAIKHEPQSKPQPEPEAKTTSQEQPAPPASSAPPPTTLALVVDDEPANRDFLMRLLEQAKLDVKGASRGKEALDIASQHENIALLVIDHKLPDMDGADLITQLRQRYPKACFIMATMLDERSLMDRAFENGCNVFLVKPHGFMELFRRLQTVGPDPEKLNRLIIDQYGLRPYRG